MVSKNYTVSPVSIMAKCSEIAWNIPKVKYLEKKRNAHTFELIFENKSEISCNCRFLVCVIYPMDTCLVLEKEQNCTLQVAHINYAVVLIDVALILSNSFANLIKISRVLHMNKFFIIFGKIFKNFL